MHVAGSKLPLLLVVPMISGVVGVGLGCEGVTFATHSSGDRPAAETSSPQQPAVTLPETVSTLSVHSMRRLTRDEVSASIHELFGQTIDVTQALPDDIVGVENPFNNDRERQAPQISGLVQSVLSVAEAVTNAVLPPAALNVRYEGAAATTPSPRPPNVGTAINVWTTASFTFTTAAAGPYRLSVGAYGEQLPTDPVRMAVKVDGVEKLRAEVTATEAAPGTWSVQLALGAGAHVVEVAFLNDAWNATTGEDRNLILQWVELKSEASGASTAMSIETLAGCTPSTSDDVDCLRKLATRMGRRILRRPLEAGEIEALAALSVLGKDSGHFETAASAVLTALLTHPEFIFRFELGDRLASSPEVFRLSGYTVASKLSFWLIGATPPVWLLDEAGSGALETGEGRARAARRLLADPRARTQVQKFHAQWLGYAGLGGSGAAPFWAETNALVDDIVFGGRDYRELLTSQKTFVTPELATHYALPAPATPTGDWVPYPDASRGGILSHGTFLSVQPSGGVTSPTHRGRWVMMRLLCRGMGEAPGNVPITPAPPDVCRKDYLNVLHAKGGCQSCHAQMDPIGFGLERFGLDGREREAEPDKPTCLLDGEGEVPLLGAFNGPGPLGRLIAQSDDFDACVVKHVFRFAEGRHEETGFDGKALDRWTEAFRNSGGSFTELLVALAADDHFLLRREP